MAKLLYVVDPMCSWCWGFAPVIRRLRDEAGHEVAVLAGGLRAHETRGITAELREYVQQHWRQVADASGQPFQFEGALPDGFVYNTEAACRAVVTMRQLNAAATLDYLHDVQQAFYAHSRDVTQAEVLAELATSQGISAEDFQAHWQLDASRLATAADFERKEQLGVMGFPSLLVDTGERLRLVSMGYQDYDSITRQIERRLKNAQSGLSSH